MPLVSSFDGVNRKIYLTSEIIDSEWLPIDIYREYLTERRDNHQFRGFESLIIMQGGEPTGGGGRQPRLLRLLTDSRGKTTKFILPDNASNGGFYRTRVGGTIATDIIESDPEPFDVSNLTHPIIIDYKPPEAEIIEVSTGSGLTVEQAQRLEFLEKWARADEIKTNNSYQRRDKDNNDILVDKDYVNDGNGNESLIEK